MTPSLAESKHDSNLKAKNKLAQRRHREKKKGEGLALKQLTTKLEEDLALAEHKKRLVEAEISALRLTLQIQGQPPAPKFRSLEDVAVDFAPAQSWAGFDPIGGSGLVLTSIFDPPKRLTRAHLQKMTVAQFCEFWQDLLLAAGQLAMENTDKDPSTPSAIKLKALISDCCGLYSCMACWNPLLYMRLQAVDYTAPTRHNLQRNKKASQELLERLQLSTEQRQFLARAHHQVCCRTRRLLEERRRLQEQIVLEETVYDQCQSHNLRRSVQELYQNIVAEHISVDVVWRMLFVLPLGLDSFQCFTFSVSEWPFSPDPFALLEAAADAESATAAVGAASEVKIESCPDSGSEMKTSTLDESDWAFESALLHPEERVVQEMMGAYVECHVSDHLVGLELSKAFANLNLKLTHLSN